MTSNIHTDRCREHDRTMTKDRSTSGISASDISSSVSASYLAALLASVTAERIADRNCDVSADSILEDHVSRVWWEEGGGGGGGGGAVESNTTTTTRRLHFPLVCRRSVTACSPGVDTGSAERVVPGGEVPTIQRFAQDPHGLRVNERLAYPLGGCQSSCSVDLLRRRVSSSITGGDDTRHCQRTSASKTDYRWSRKPPATSPGNAQRPDHIITNESYSSVAGFSDSNCTNHREWRNSWQRRDSNLAQDDEDADRALNRLSTTVAAVDCFKQTRSQNARELNAATLDCRRTSSADVTIVGYYLCEDPIPYRTTLPGKFPTLGQFKQLVTKKGNLRFFFRKVSDEFDSGVVHEEITDDKAVLPLWEGKIVGKIELIQ